MKLLDAQEEVFDKYQSRVDTYLKPEFYNICLGNARLLQYESNLSGKPLSMQERFYVYALLDPRKPGPFIFYLYTKKVVFDYMPFYVGKGTGKRMEVHLKRRAPGTLKQVVIDEIAEDGLLPIPLRLTPLIAESYALAIEEELIQCFGQTLDGTGFLSNIYSRGRMSRSELDDYARNKVKATWARKTPEEIAKVVSRRKATIARIPEEVRKESIKQTIANTDYDKVNQKRAQTWALKSEEERRSIRIKQSVTHRRRTKKQEEIRKAKARDTIANWSEERRAEVYQKRSEASKGNSGGSKITEREVVAIFKLYSKYKDAKKVAMKFNVSLGTVRNIATGKTRSPVLRKYGLI